MNFATMYNSLKEMDFEDYDILFRLSLTFKDFRFRIDTEDMDRVFIIDNDDNSYNINIDEGYFDVVKNVIETFKKHTIYLIENVEDFDNFSHTLNMYNSFIQKLQKDIEDKEINFDTKIYVKYYEMGSFGYKVLKEEDVYYLDDFMKEFASEDTDNVWALEERKRLFEYMCDFYNANFIIKDDIDFNYCIRNKESVDY